MMDEEMIIEANNAFSIELYSNLQEAEKNLFFSPFSILKALAMVYTGARGLTENQIKQTLHINLDQSRFHTEFIILLKNVLRKIPNLFNYIKLRNHENYYPKSNKLYLR